MSLNKFEEMVYANCSVTGRQKGQPKEQGITDEDAVKKNGKEGRKGTEKIGKGTKTNETGKKERTRENRRKRRGAQRKTDKGHEKRSKEVTKHNAKEIKKGHEKKREER